MPFVLSGRLRAVVARQSLIPPQRCVELGLPAGSISQLVKYFDSMGLVATAHQYRHPDGSVGASGRPDPKQVLVDGELWVLESRSASRPD